MTGLEFVREVFPKATQEEADFLLWNATAFPMGDIDHNRKQLRIYKNTIDAGGKPCDCCNAPIGKRSSWLCDECVEVMKGDG